MTNCDLKTKLKSVLLFGTIVIFGLLATFFIYLFIDFKEWTKPIDWKLMWRIPFMLIMIPIIVIQLKFRANVTCFSDDLITVRGFWGLGRARIYRFTEIEGFIIDKEMANGGLREYITLNKGKRVVSNISSFYHKNYDELKEYIFSNFKCLSDER